MTPIVGVSIVVGLAVAFLFARLTARRIRERRALQRHRLKRSVHKRRRREKTTQRSEMRAYEDQTTVMGDITTTDRQKLRS